VETGIGATLREARGRRRLDLAEVEAAIKIRIRYLQAMENEEWDALPGDAYARGFIRTYAIHLGLDGERLADEYMRSVAVGGDRAPKRVEPVPASARGQGPRIPTGLLAVAVTLVLAALVVAIGLAGGEDDPSMPEPKGGTGSAQLGSASRPTTEARKPGVEVTLAATSEVWVCLLDGGEEALVDGQILEQGADAGPFRSSRFEVALGNGSVEMTIDGRKAEVPPSSSPVGYEIDSDGGLDALEEGERPDCE
jgi:cytoskeleton protein RodZ